MKHFSLFVAMLFAAFATQASPLWMRYPAISPDGQKVAFTYKGSIYVVPSAGGEAVRLTSTDNHDSQPI